MAALVEAATDLFAERGPDAVSLRDVAARAGVNYGLIHQYVGSKEDLLHLVFRSLSEGAAVRLAAADDLAAAMDLLTGTPETGSRYVRMLAWAVLQGRDPAELLGRSPALTALLDRLPDGPPDGEVGAEDPRVRVAAMIVLSLGWRLLGPFVQSGVGLADVPADEMAAMVRDVARLLAEGLPAGPSRRPA